MGRRRGVREPASVPELKKKVLKIFRIDNVSSVNELGEL